MAPRPDAGDTSIAAAMASIAALGTGSARRAGQQEAAGRRRARAQPGRFEPAYRTRQDPALARRSCLGAAACRGLRPLRLLAAAFRTRSGDSGGAGWGRAAPLAAGGLRLRRQL